MPELSPNLETSTGGGVEESTTTEGDSTRLFRAKFTETTQILKETQSELDKVNDLPEFWGERLMSMLSKFDQFPWAQDTMVAAAQLEEVLIMFLHKHLLIEGQTLRD